MHRIVARHLLLLCLAGTGCTPGNILEAPAERGRPACPVTTRASPAFVPPSPFPPEPPAGHEGNFWYGAAALWTMLDPHGLWASLPRNDAGYVQKVFWWADGYSASREPRPDITVTGRRLEGEGGALIASQGTNASGDFGEAMPVGVIVPTAGCWEIKGIYHETSLTFVVQVEP